MSRSDTVASVEPSIAGNGAGVAHVAQEVAALDRLVHEPARLAILAVLHSAAEVDFNFLQAATGLTKGNLSRQASKLEEAGYIAIRKYFRGKIPATGYRLTATGQAAFTRYWERLNALGQQVGPKPGTMTTPQGDE